VTSGQRCLRESSRHPSSQALLPAHAAATSAANRGRGAPCGADARQASGSSLVSASRRSVGQRSDQRGDVRRRPCRTLCEPLWIRLEPLRTRAQPLRILRREPLRTWLQPPRIDRDLRLRPQLVIAVRSGRVQNQQLAVSQPAQEGPRRQRVEFRDGPQARVVEADCTVGLDLRNRKCVALIPPPPSSLPRRGGSRAGGSGSSLRSW